MLPRNYRITVYNDSGASADITVTARRWKIDSNGAVVFEATEATLLTATGAADASLSTGTVQDNSSDLYIGLSGVMSLTGDGAGIVTVFLEPSTDGGTAWPSSQNGIPLGAGVPGDDIAFTV